jgi:hypothetical protein
MLPPLIVVGFGVVVWWLVVAGKKKNAESATLGEGEDRDCLGFMREVCKKLIGWKW